MAMHERCGVNFPQYMGLEPIKSSIPRKRRFQDGQNLIRWDVEEPEYVKEVETSLDMLRLCFEYHLENGGFDAVIFTDYDKGLFRDVNKTRDLMAICHAHGIPTIVDPKDEKVSIYIEENEKEITYKKLLTLNNKLIGFALLNLPDRAGIYTSLINDDVKLDSLNYDITKKDIGLNVFPQDIRHNKLFRGNNK
jgi:hypothetical protein